MSSSQSVQAKLSELADEIKEIRESRQRLEEKVLKLQEDNLELKKEIFNNEKENHNLKQKLGVMEEAIRQHGLEIKEIKKLTPDTASKTDVTKTVESRVATVADLEQVFNRTIVARHDTQYLEKEMDELKQRTGQLEMTRKNIQQSVLSVDLSTKEGLTNGSQIKLDQCRQVYINKGMFEMYTCNIVPQCNGVFGFGLQTRQWGEGKVDMTLRWEGDDEGGWSAGRTESDWDECTGVACVHLEKGQKAWVTAEGVEGKATVGCRLVCWLMD